MFMTWVRRNYINHLSLIKLTGGARAASRIEFTPFLGDCKTPKSLKTLKAI